MAGKDTKAALLLALTPKEGGKSPVKSGEDEPEGDDATDLMSAIADKDGAALKAVIRRIALSCMAEEGDEGEA